MLTYCVKQRKQTECVPGSETFLVTKNGRNAMKCQCVEFGITKFRFLSKREGGSFDELIVKGLAAGTKGLLNLGRIGASKAMKSDFAKKKMKEIGEKYLGQVIDSVTDDLSKKIDPQTGGRVDIHKAIGKLPKPKSGWTLPGHKYTGPYNDLEKQLKYDPGTGKILEIYDQPMLCSMMWTTLFVEIIRSANMEQIEKWYKLWMLYPGMRDSGVIGWLEMLLTPKESYD